MASTCTSCASDVQPAAARRLELAIETMDCPTEAGLIRKRLGGLDGVEQLDFDLLARRLTVSHRLDTEEPVLRALAEIGMPATLVQAGRAATGKPAAESARTVTTWRIAKMDCPTEEALLRKAVGVLPDIEELRFDLMQRTLTVRHALADPAPIAQAIRRTGMEPELVADSKQPAIERAAQAAAPLAVSHAQWLQMAAAGVAAVGSEIVAYATGSETSWPVVLLALAAIAVGGRETLAKGWIALKTRSLNMNLLMTVAVIGAAAIGQWPEAAVVIWLFGIAEMIEALSLDRARHAIRSLMALAPEAALVRQPDGSFAEMRAERVAKDAIVRVRPGERIALDGVVASGESTVNQAPVTGESMPVEKRLGEAVFAGSINERGTFEYRVTGTKGDTMLDRIARSVQDAQASRAPTQRFVDRFAQVYTPIVFAAAIGVAVIPPLAFGAAWYDWVYRALVLLVIACPCALVISTPVTVVSGLAAGARRGILVKGGLYLEQGRHLEAIALDKTGTLTHGRPALTDVVTFGGLDCSQALRIAASIDALSEHPVAAAIVAGAGGQALARVEGFEALPGRGVRGSLDGRAYYLGNPRLARELDAQTPELADVLERIEAQAKTAVVLAEQGRALAVLAVADTVRPASRDAVAQLKALGVQTVMLTGDNARTARAVAAQVGIDDARGDLLPEDKLAAIGELARHGTVGMVGDGVNDAPALAKADIGFAMGAAGTDTAIETADVALMQDDLRKLPEFIRLSRRTGAVLWQNIAFAIGIKVVFFVLTLFGLATLWMAVAADMGASLVVVANGLRVMRARM